MIIKIIVGGIKFHANFVIVTSKMNILRLIIATVIGATVMFGMSYFWHGVLLTDLQFISYDKKLFFGLLAIAYLAISGSLSFVLMVYKPLEHRIAKHSTIAVASGFVVYLLAFVLGISIEGGGLEHTFVNFIWQMIEQGVGGFAISSYYILAHRREKLIAFEDVRDE